MAGEELVRQRVAFQSVAASAGGDEVAGDVGSAVGERVDVVERGRLRAEAQRAVDAAAPTVAERGVA